MHLITSSDHTVLLVSRVEFCWESWQALYLGKSVVLSPQKQKNIVTETEGEERSIYIQLCSTSNSPERVTR